MLTQNRTLPDTSEVVRKNWYILQITPEFYVFVNKRAIAFTKNKNMQDFISDQLIRDGKVAEKKSEKRKGKNEKCNTTR